MRFGFQAGINKGILVNSFGPSFSFHYALRTDKVVQLESMLFLDRSSGRTFLSEHLMNSLGVGLAAGIRINFCLKKTRILLC